MPETVPYSNHYDPPAPVLRTLVSVPEDGTGSSAEEVVALCDTGADITAVPTDVIARLGLAEVDEIQVEPYEGEPMTKPVYAALVQLPGLTPQIARVIPVDGQDAVLGRDLLNSLRLELDGPSQILRLL